MRVLKAWRDNRPVHPSTTKHRSIRGYFDLDREERDNGKIKVGYKVVSEKLKLF